jgi:RHS repeat-associated protein
VAMREAGTLYWLLTDHLWSVNKAVRADGTLPTPEQRYKAFGDQRYSSGTMPTTYQYTGQRAEQSLGIYYYGARWYDPYLNRWIQPDTIIPDQYDSQSWDRYAYLRHEVE